MQDLDGCFEAEALARPVVDPVDGLLDLLVGDLVEQHGLGEVLSEQPVGLLVQAALPAVVGSGVVGAAAGGLGDDGVVGELAPVVVGDGVDDAFEAAGDAAQDTGRLGRGLARDVLREQHPGFVLGERHEAAAVVVADDGVPFPVAEARVRVHDRRSLGDVRPAWQPAPVVVLPVALPAPSGRA